MFLELSYILSEKIPNYPDSVPERFERILSQEKGDVSNTTLVYHYTHNGTHVDAPYHFDSNGWKIHEIPISYFIYENPLFLNFPKGPEEKITLKEVQNVPNVEKADLLIFRTGFGELREKDPITYRFLFPGLEVDLARFIREELENVKAIMIDFLSVDPLIEGNQKGFVVHKQLLSKETSSKRPVLIIEDVFLEPLIDQNVKRVFALPIRFMDVDGAPVSVVAEI